jgi:flagella basal body P-ring formation protein FlgA
MNAPRLAIAVCCALLQGAPATAAPTAVLQAHVRLDRDEVRLGDLAAVTGADAATVAGWRALVVGTSPRTLTPQCITRAQLARILRATPLQLAGADGVCIERVQEALDDAELHSLARPVLDAWLARHAEHWNVADTDAAEKPAVPSGRRVLRVRPLDEAAPLAPTMDVWIDVAVDGRYVRSVPVRFAVQAYRRVLAVRDAAEAGALLEPGMTVWREVDVARQPAALTALGPGRQRLRRSVEAGTVLTPASLAAAPAVARGDKLVLSLAAGAVSLQKRVEALQDGAVGQRVRVRPEQGAEPFEARVTGVGQVEIEGP